MRADGWRDWVFKWSERFVEFLRVPSRQILAEPVELAGLPEDAVCVWMDMSDVWHTDLDWASRVILHSTELPEFRDKDDEVRKKQLLWSRATVKDAARLWISGEGSETMPHPASLLIEHDELGRPSVRSMAPGARIPSVSLSHKERASIAIASSVPVGVDFEPASRDIRALLPKFATEEEIELLESHGSGLDSPETRLWCAKEAVAKCLGTGFQGRPKDFVALHAGEDGVFGVEHRPTGQRFRATTTRMGEWVVAYAFGEES